MSDLFKDIPEFVEVRVDDASVRLATAHLEPRLIDLGGHRRESGFPNGKSL